jgi:hypothetical protein
VARRDAEERDSLELAKHVQADDVGIELLDRLQIADPEDGLTDGLDGRIQRLDLRGPLESVAARETSWAQDCVQEFVSHDAGCACE